MTLTVRGYYLSQKRSGCAVPGVGLARVSHCVRYLHAAYTPSWLASSLMGRFTTLGLVSILTHVELREEVPFHDSWPIPLGVMIGHAIVGIDLPPHPLLIPTERCRGVWFWLHEAGIHVFLLGLDDRIEASDALRFAVCNLIIVVWTRQLSRINPVGLSVKEQ